MGSTVHKCQHAWLCCPGWLRFLILFTIVNVFEDAASFPIVHSFWNYVGFEGWFMDAGS